MSVSDCCPMCGLLNCRCWTTTPYVPSVFQMPVTWPIKTLRDEFAMAALQGMLANSNFIANAQDAYLFADAMLEEREPKKEK